MKKILFFSFLGSLLFCDCNRHNVNEKRNSGDSSITLQKNKSAAPNTSTNDSGKIVFLSGDSLRVMLSINSSTRDKLGFTVETKNKKLEGVANLILDYDSGKPYLPESTPIRDEQTNEEYKCDSSFSYESGQINFVFAMENFTKKRLCFIITNSSINGLSNNFYTLYREKR